MRRRPGLFYFQLRKPEPHLPQLGFFSVVDVVQSPGTKMGGAGRGFSLSHSSLVPLFYYSLNLLVLPFSCPYTPTVTVRDLTVLTLGFASGSGAVTSSHCLNPSVLAWLSLPDTEPTSGHQSPDSSLLSPSTVSFLCFGNVRKSFSSPGPYEFIFFYVKSIHHAEPG